MANITDKDIAELRRMQRKLNNISGPGVVNNSESVYISPQPATKGNDGNNGIKVITAQLTEQDGSDPTKYAWQAARRLSGGWEVVTNGLTGTLDKTPAYHLDADSTDDLTNTYVMLALLPFKKDDGTSSVAWVIVGGQGGSLPQPDEQGQVMQATAQGVYGWAFPTLHSAT